jgi:acid phosphatase (class A)
VLPAPPESGSLAAQADMEAVLEVQARRTPADAAWAGAVLKEDAFASCAPVIGSWFKKDSLPLTDALLQDASKDSRAVGSAVKKVFARSRPWVVDAAVKPCVELPKSDSYPSEFSMQTFVRAGVLAEIFPEKREALLVVAHRAAWARIVGGVHFPTDDVGGRLMAEFLVAEFRKSPAFVAAVQQARAEVQAVARETGS